MWYSWQFRYLLIDVPFNIYVIHADLRTISAQLRTGFYYGIVCRTYLENQLYPLPVQSMFVEY